MPAWRLSAGGQVARLVTEGGEEVGVAQIEPRDAGVAWVCGPGGVGKRVRLNRKNSATPCSARFCGYSVPATCVEETWRSSRFGL